MSAETVLVVNPTAGKGRAQAMLSQVAGVLRDAGLDPDVCLSRDFNEARTMAREAVRAGCRSLIMMGGDGMMHLGVNTVAEQHDGQTTLGLVPAGTGNDLCRGLGLDPMDPVAAAGIIASRVTRRIDLAVANGHYVAAVIGTGFDALVNGRANAMRRPKGALRYPLAALAELRVFTPLSYRLTIDGEVRDLSAMLVAIGNAGSYGGGMVICPDADPSDGWLDVTIIHPVSRWKLIRLLPETYSGRFVRDPCVERLRAREVIVEGPGLVGYGDGELIGAAPLHIGVRPAAIEVFAPHP